MVPTATLEAARRAGDSLANGDIGPVRALFASLNYPEPMVIGDPAPEAIVHEAARPLFDWYRENRTASGGLPPPVGTIDPFVLKPFLGDLAVVQPGEERGDFRFRLYGSTITEASHTDPTGRSIFDLPDLAGIPMQIPIFFGAINLAAVETKRAWLSVHRPPSHIGPHLWHRLCLPFAAADGSVTRLVVQILPLRSSAMKEIVPVSSAATADPAASA